MLQLRDELVTVVGLNGLGIDLHGRTKARVDQAHHIDLLLHMAEHVFFGQVILAEKRLPGRVAGSLRILFASFRDAAGGFRLRGVAEIRRLHLFAQQFLIDQAVEHGAAIVVGELPKRTMIEQRFVTKRFVPLRLQNNAAVDGGNDAVDNLSGCAGGGDEVSPEEYCDCQQQERILRTQAVHQNGWPMLKNTLKWRRRCAS